MTNLPIRKPNRLKVRDYSERGAYFITICTKKHEKIFGKIVPSSPSTESTHTDDVGAACSRPQIYHPQPYHMELSQIGQIVENEIKTLSATYKNTRVSKYIVMPNHVHMIIVIKGDAGGGGRLQAAPTLSIEGDLVGKGGPTVSRMVKQWKRAVSVRVGFSPWQKSFHDHVIRDLDDYYFIEKYIENNPVTWGDDCFYREEQ